MLIGGRRRNLEARTSRSRAGATTASARDGADAARRIAVATLDRAVPARERIVL